MSSEGRQSYGLYIATVTSAVTMHSSTCKYWFMFGIHRRSYLPFQNNAFIFYLRTTESSRCLLTV